MTWKYYAKKILYYLRQQKILNNLKAFLQHSDDYESYLEGEALTTLSAHSYAVRGAGVELLGEHAVEKSAVSPGLLGAGVYGLVTQVGNAELKFCQSL